MTGYWRDPSLTATVLKEHFAPGRPFYKTGDLVWRDEADRYF